MRTLICITALVTILGCDKKDDDKASPEAAGVQTTANAPASITKPVGVLAVTMNTMSSIGGAMTGIGSALHLDGGDSFTEADCNDNASAMARESDPSEHKDDQNRLRLQNPRMPLQSFYCQMQKDTGSPDSFIGSLSELELLLCVAGDGLVFDGTGRKKTLTRAEFIECIKTKPQEQQDEILAEFGESASITVTANRPAAFGAKDTWDGSVLIEAELAGQKNNIRVLLRDSNDVVAIATNKASGDATLPVDSFVASINKATGEVNFESQFQRIRSANGNSSNGWNRHARAYVKGTMDANMKFGKVTAISGIFSDISLEMGGVSASGLQMGTMWSVTGTEAAGVKSVSKQLNCTWNQETQKSTCTDPNVAANWVATAGSGACNGGFVDTSCGAALDLSTNEDTQFFMDGNNTAFLKTEDWLTSLGKPDFSAMTFKN